ncbi:MAG: tRNA preQ1(34) S-adenosylmethionine ribosyltransferase-isomerase QueA [Betaproteobacteria bacterium]|nr:MAG: tRNA preQ1(34) S-adenosylmethionine ribosyltransferase-isomerase QueA [Betaproteobacteria bacterium]
MKLTLSDFDYALPPDLIAQAPADERTSSRLLHVAGDAFADLHFRDLPELIAPGDLLVLNDTRVIRARLIGRKPTGGRVEALIERIVDRNEAWLQIKASHMPKIGSSIDFAGRATATVVARDERLFRLRFDIDEPLLEWLERHGEVPLPPYITRQIGDDDARRYQTVYARYAGAVAAPTAGLHFDTSMLAALARRGVGTAFVTLHVGAGTFSPVESKNLSQHRMHAERFDVPATTAQAIAITRARGGRILAVGTTTLRALESAADAGGGVQPLTGETRLFIIPGFRFRVVDRLLTNFHLPKSTLLMLVSAFAGMETVRRAYRHAVAKRYRFFSYGDAMLIDRTDGDSANG